MIKIRGVTSFSDFLFLSKIPHFLPQIVPRVSQECPKCHHVLCRNNNGLSHMCPKELSQVSQASTGICRTFLVLE
jgi:hypothetical protein